MNAEISQLKQRRRSYDLHNDLDEIAIDNELGGRMAAGDEQALNLFVYRWRKYVVSYVKYRTYDPTNEDIEDMVSEILTEVWNAVRAGRWRGGHFVWFFFAVLRVETTRKLQKLGRKRKKIIKEKEAFYNGDLGRSPCPEKETICAMFEDDLCDALLELNPKQRLAFILVHVEGYTRTDIAKKRMLGVSKRDTVSRYVSQACEQLQNKLADWR